MIELPCFAQVSDGRVPPLDTNTLGIEFELCPKQEIQVDGFAVRRDLADKIHSTVVPCLCDGYELLDGVFSLQPKLSGATLYAESRFRSCPTACAATWITSC